MYRSSPPPWHDHNEETEGCQSNQDSCRVHSERSRRRNVGRACHRRERPRVRLSDSRSRRQRGVIGSGRIARAGNRCICIESAIPHPSTCETIRHLTFVFRYSLPSPFRESLKPQARANRSSERSSYPVKEADKERPKVCWESDSRHRLRFLFRTLQNAYPASSMPRGTGVIGGSTFDKIL